MYRGVSSDKSYLISLIRTIFAQRIVRTLQLQLAGQQGGSVPVHPGQPNRPDLPFGAHLLGSMRFDAIEAGPRAAAMPPASNVLPNRKLDVSELADYGQMPITWPIRTSGL